MEMALSEDAPFGDVTSEHAVPNVEVEGVVVAKGGGIMAARPLFEAVMGISNLEILQEVEEGEEFQPGTVLATIRGRAREVLLVERTMLNVLGRMCGIAKLTSEYVRRAKGVPIYDTRKTMPLLRYYDKYAVRVGGGHNHRFTLSEIAMVKDNHKRIVGSVREAVMRLRKALPHVPLVVEVESVDELRSLRGLSVDWVLLDNMPVAVLREAIPLARELGFKVEVSGGIDLSNVEEYAALKPDRISVGALTKAALPVDVSLEVLRWDPSSASPS